MIKINLYFFLNYLLSNCIDSSNYLSNLRPYTNVSINLLNCFFTRFNLFNGGNGGIVYCYNQISNLYIGDSIFHLCSTNGWGGAIYFLTINNVNCKLEKNCANYCFAGVNHFSYIAPLTSLSNNECYLVSITKCSNQTIGTRSFQLHGGKITVNNLNSSYNINVHVSSIWIAYPSQFIGKFWTICNNVAQSTTIFLHGSSGYNFLTYSNIIKNNSPNSNGVITVWDNGIYELNVCYLINNFNNLFYLQSGQLKINNCLINHDFHIYISSTGIFSTFNNINLFSNTFNIIQLNTHYCHTDEIINLLSCNYNKFKINSFINIITILIN